MYCRKCGKYIDYDAPYCVDCEEMDSFFGASENRRTSARPVEIETPPARPAMTGDRKEGFGNALAATILSGVSFFFGLIAMSFATVVLEEYTYGYAPTLSLLSIPFAFCLVAVVCGILGLVKGIKSIKCFKEASRAGRVKPVVTLVLGIVGVSMSGLALLYVELTFLMLSLLFLA